MSSYFFVFVKIIVNPRNTGGNDDAREDNMKINNGFVKINAAAPDNLKKY